MSVIIQERTGFPTVVDGPAGATDGELALFDGTSGKLIKGGGSFEDSLNDNRISTSVTIAGNDYDISHWGFLTANPLPTEGQPFLVQVTNIGDGQGALGAAARVYNALDDGSEAPTAVSVVRADTSGRLVSADPVGLLHVANKQYVDGLFSGLGSAASADVGDFATAAQGSLADTAVQPNQIREVLTSDRTYYVRTDGDDGNDGLSNTSGGAFATIQHAINVVAALDHSIYTVGIQVAPGTYSNVSVSVTVPWVGRGNVTIQGAPSGSPSGYVLDLVAPGILVSGTSINIGGLKLQSSEAGVSLISSTKGAVTTVTNCEFGTSLRYHMAASAGGSITNADGADYTISGGASAHLYAEGGTIRNITKTITLSGSPAWSGSFIYASQMSYIDVRVNVFSGASTGIRYDVKTGSIIDTSGAGATYLPGSTPGNTSTNGLYI